MRWIVGYLVLVASVSLATEYRVGDGGVTTLAEATAAAKAGDVIHVQEGVYREVLRPASGVRVIGEGRVIISGADPLEAQAEAAREGDALKFVTKQRFVQLFVDGQMMPEACFPNRPVGEFMAYPRGQAGAGTGYEVLADEKLPQADLTGAIIHLWNGERWWSTTRRVASCVPGKQLTFDKTFVPDKPDEYHGFDPYKPKAGNPYVVFGHRALLDAPGEWYLDEKTGELWIIPPDGRELTHDRITVKTRDLVLDLSKSSNVQIKGIEFVAGAPSLADSTDCVVEDCRFTFIEHFREFPQPWQAGQQSLVTGRNNVIRRCGFAYSAGSAIRLRGENNKLLDSIVHDVNYMGTPQGGVMADNSVGAVIDSCTIHRIGRDGIMHGNSKRITITHNDISSVCMINADSGAIYCWGTDGSESVIAYNRVHDNTGDATVGIYLDNFSKGFTVHHNISWNNTGAGITLNSDAENHLVANNTMVDNGATFGTYTYVGRTPTQKGTRIVNNLVTARIKYDNPGTFVQGELGPKLQNNGPAAVDAQGAPVPGSAAIDSGIVVPVITDGFTGKAPDLGAIEVGHEPFRSGATWTWGPEVKRTSLAWAPMPPLSEETMIRDGLLLWLDASQAGAVQQDDKGVSKWIDRSGNGRDASVQRAPGLKLVQKAIGGRAAIDGNGPGVLRVDNMPADLSQATLIMVASAPGDPGKPWQRLASAWTGQDNDWVPPNWLLMRPSEKEPAPFETKVFTAIHRRPVTLRNFSVLGSMATDQGFEGLIGEILLYGRALDDEEQSAVEAYLERKWEISGKSGARSP